MHTVMLQAEVTIVDLFTVHLIIYTYKHLYHKVDKNTCILSLLYKQEKDTNNLICSALR